MAERLDRVFVSVLLPTRGRPGPLAKSLESLWSHSRDRDYEVLLAVDEDDSATLSVAQGLPAPSLRVEVGERWGYRELHRYVNRLSELARGEWLFLWNDDLLMETQGWDRVVGAFSGRFLVLSPSTNHDADGCYFPLLPRAWSEILGHVSLSNHFDTWVEEVAKLLGILTRIPVRLLHDRFDLTGSNDDATAREREFTSGDFYSPSMQALRRLDAERLQSALAAEC